jgi:hypothetical protein
MYCWVHCGGYCCAVAAGGASLRCEGAGARDRRVMSLQRSKSFHSDFARQYFDGHDPTLDA